MLVLRIFSFFFFLFVSFSLFAESRGQCVRFYSERESLFRFSYLIHEQVSGEMRGYLPEVVERVSLAVREINQLIPSSVLTPPRVRLLFRDYSGFSRLKDLESGGVEIELAIPFSFSSLPRQDVTRHLVAMALHEYGHAILDRTLSARSDVFRRNLLIEAQPNLFTKAEKDRAFIDLLFVKGYEEFFADFVSVLFLSDSNAIRDAMIAANETMDESAIRSFSNSHKIDGWEYVGAYGLLAPTRTFLEPYLSTSDKGHLLEAVLSAMDKSIAHERTLLLQKYRKGMSYLELEINPEQVNRRFIQILKTELKPR